MYLLLQTKPADEQAYNNHGSAKHVDILISWDSTEQNATNKLGIMQNSRNVFGLCDCILSGKLSRQSSEGLVEAFASC